jgi:hypothetical protein
MSTQQIILEAKLFGRKQAGSKNIFAWHRQFQFSTQ